MFRLKLPGTWKHVPSWDDYEFVVVWFSFVYALLDSVSNGSWADVEEKNIRQNGHWMLETSCKVGLQPEGAHYHSETVIN